MAIAITVARATLISIVVQALFFGIYSVLFAFTQWTIFNRRHRAMNKPLWAASLLMFIIALAHLIIDGTRLTAFLRFSRNPTQLDAYLGNLSDPAFLAKSNLYQIQTWIGDACLIYRTTMLYHRKKYVVTVPVLLLVVSIVAGSGMMWAFSGAPPDATPLTYQHWAVPYIVGTLFTTLICTVLIVVHILRLSPASMAAREIIKFTPALVVVESGAMYSVSLVWLTVLSVSKSNAYTVVLDALCPIIGIVFSLIILRVHNERPRPRPTFLAISNVGYSPSALLSSGTSEEVMDITKEKPTARHFRLDAGITIQEIPPSPSPPSE